MWRKHSRGQTDACMLMPVEEYAKTEGKQWIEKKTKQGKANFFGKECLHGSESEKLKLSRRYCEGKGEGKRDGKQSQVEESEGKKEKKNHNAINNEERRWIYELNPCD